MRCLIAPDIFQAVLYKYPEVYTPSRKILELCEDGVIFGIMTALDYYDLYIEIKEKTDPTTARCAVTAITDIVGIVSVGFSDIFAAILKEDSGTPSTLQNMIAVQQHCKYIISNVLYGSTQIPIVSAKEFEAKLEERRARE